MPSLAPGVVFARRGGGITSEKNGRWRINHEPRLFHVMLMTPPASCVSFAQDAKVQAGTPRGVILLFTGFRTTHLLDAIAGNKTLSPLSTFIHIQRPSDGASERQFAIFVRRYRSTSNEKYSRVNDVSE